jgi:hypothetical protein
MLPTKFRFIWPNGFRGEEFLKSANQKQESPVAVMFVNGSGRNEQSLQRTFHRCFLPSFGSFGQAEEVVYYSDKYHDKLEFIASRRMMDLAGIIYRFVYYIHITIAQSL